MTNILYISYDGLTDPLGQSQILPYLAGLANQNYIITLLSLEKPEPYKTNALVIENLLKGTSIKWIPLPYSTKKGLFAKRKNNKLLANKARQIITNQKTNLIHARSYPASIIAQNLSAKYTIPFIFDMRGFWADERIDGKIWSLKKPHHRLLYNYFKRKEIELLKKSTHVISLTQAAKNYMCTKFASIIQENKITVIPCCADLDLFNLADKKTLRQSTRIKLNIEENQPVFIYLGSIGTWYLLDQMLDFFKTYMESKPNAVFLLVTQNDHEQASILFKHKNISAANYRIEGAKRNEVPAYIHAADTAIYFIKPAFSKMASSPVKLAEFMGCGLPVIANQGIGDVDLQASENEQLITVKELNEQGYRSAIKQLDATTVNPENNRKFAEKNYSLSMGIERYLEVYKNILEK